MRCVSASEQPQFLHLQASFIVNAVVVCFRHSWADRCLFISSCIELQFAHWSPSQLIVQCGLENQVIALFVLIKKKKKFSKILWSSDLLRIVTLAENDLLIIVELNEC